MLFEAREKQFCCGGPNLLLHLQCKEAYAWLAVDSPCFKRAFFGYVIKSEISATVGIWEWLFEYFFACQVSSGSLTKENATIAYSKPGTCSLLPSKYQSASPSCLLRAAYNCYYSILLYYISLNVCFMEANNGHKYVNLTAIWIPACEI